MIYGTSELSLGILTVAIVVLTVIVLGGILYLAERMHRAIKRQDKRLEANISDLDWHGPSLRELIQRFDDTSSAGDPK